MITGLIEFKDNTCVFKLDKEKFILEIEEIEERENESILEWDFLLNRKPKEKIPGKDLLEKDLLVGKDFEKGQIIHFSIRNLEQTGTKTYTANLKSYIKFVGSETSFDGLQIQADELNWFHNISQAFERYTFFGNGGTQFQLNPHDQTTKEFEFDLNSELIAGNLSISTMISRPSTSPIKLIANLNYHFGITTEVSRAEELVFLTKQLLQFLTYRKNLHINNLILKKKNVEDGKYRHIGYLFINNYISGEKEEEKVIRERIIDYPLIETCFPQLLKKLTEKTIYLTHIPESSKVNSTITPARFIMATAGFEWQIRFSHEDRSEESEEKYKEQKAEILEFLEEKIEKNTGKNKKYFKNIKRFLIKSDSSLSEKIVWALNEFDEVMEVFIKHIYQLNSVESVHYEYQNIAERIQTQRNNIAHGNIDKELDDFVILDFLVLEWLYYAMVLDDIGVSKENIKRSINQLFRRNLAL